VNQIKTDDVCLSFRTSQVLIPANATEFDLVAAADLIQYVHKLSGVTLPVVVAEKANRTLSSIYVGYHPAEYHAAKVDVSRLEDEGYVVRCFPDKNTGRFGVLLGGGSLGGVSSAVRAVLRSVGVRWLWPGDSGEVFPPAHVHGLDRALNLTGTPALLERNFRDLYNNQGIMQACGSYPHRVSWVNQTVVKELALEELAWLGRMGMSRGGIGVGGPGDHGKPLTPPWGQAFGTWWDLYGANGSLGHHPEWFAMQPGGRRGPPAGESPAGVKMCVSQPTLWQKIAVAMEPGSLGVSACEDDGDRGFCTCSKCKALDSNGTAIEEGSMSDRYAYFWDSVAHTLEQTHPQAWVTGYAYDNYTAPPQFYRMTHNVMVGLVVEGGDWGYPAKPSELERDRGWWRGWSDAGARRMFLRPNVGYGTWGIGGAPFGEATVLSILLPLHCLSLRLSVFPCESTVLTKDRWDSVGTAGGGRFANLCRARFGRHGL
jgi:hypothetical protein